MKYFALFLLLLLLNPAVAHNVVGTVYVVADTIEGEVGFSNGTMAEAGLPVEVIDEAGAQITTIETLAGGTFKYTPTTYQDHAFIVDLGGGHKKVLGIDKIELPDTLKSPSTQSEQSPQSAQPTPPAQNNISSADLEKAIEVAVAKQIKPLDKSINELINKAEWRDIIGGIGYIFGLFGLGIWLSSRKAKKHDSGNE